MGIYIFIVFLILVLGYFQKSGKIGTKTYCCVIGVIFAIVTGLRSVNVGSDTTVYYLGYEDLKTISTLPEAISYHGDIAYYTFAWLMARGGVPFWGLTLAVACLFYYSVSKLIYRYSEDKALSYLILMAFNFFQFSMTGIRQTIALAFALFALYEAFKPDYKLLKILIYIAVGYLFHNSCAVFLLLLPMLVFKHKYNKGLVFLSVLIVLAGFVFRTSIMGMMISLSSDTRFEFYDMENTGAGFTTYIMYFLIYIILLYNMKSYADETRRGTLDLWLMVATLLFQGTVLIQSVMFRVAWYFAISLVVILPQIIKTFSQQNKTIANFTAYALILFMYLGITIGSAHVVPYQFFWE